MEYLLLFSSIKIIQVTLAIKDRLSEDLNSLKANSAEDSISFKYSPTEVLCFPLS